MARIAADQPMQKMETSRYRLEEPVEKARNDPSAWKQVLDDSRLQLEHQSLRLLNLELMSRFGANQWIQYNEHLEQLINSSQKELEALKAQALQLNSQRKSEQLAAGTQMEKLQTQWLSLISKNLEIEYGTSILESEISNIRVKYGLPEPDLAESELLEQPVEAD